MSGPEFFQTRMGQVFYESTMPRLVDQIKRVADCMVAAEQRAIVADTSAPDDRALLTALRASAPDERPAGHDVTPPLATTGAELLNKWRVEAGLRSPERTVITAQDITQSFLHQLDTCKAGIRLKGSMDAAQHELLVDVVRQHAANLAQALEAMADED